MTEWCPIHGPDPRGPQRPDVTLMADYGCFLWTNSPELYRCRTDGNLDPAKLGASADLAERLKIWHQEWEDVNYGASASDDWDDEWERRGWELARELQRQLGPGFNVHYRGYDGRGSRPVVDNPD